MLLAAFSPFSSRHRAGNVCGMGSLVMLTTLVFCTWRPEGKETTPASVLVFGTVWVADTADSQPHFSFKHWSGDRLGAWGSPACTSFPQAWRSGLAYII